MLVYQRSQFHFQASAVAAAWAAQARTPCHVTSGEPSCRQWTWTDGGAPPGGARWFTSNHSAVYIAQYSGIMWDYSDAVELRDCKFVFLYAFWSSGKS